MENLQFERYKSEECGELYKNIFNQTPLILLLIDQNHRIIEANLPACEFYGYSENALKDKNITDLFTLPEDINLTDTESKGIKIFKRIFLKHSTVNGGVRDLELFLKSFEFDNTNYYLLVINDITEKVIFENTLQGRDEYFKKISEKLKIERETLAQNVLDKTAKLRKANFELEKASKLKDEFLAIISHELRTPLNAIINITQSMIEGAYDSITEKQAKSLNIIDKSSAQLLTLINDILDFSKIEAGKVEINPSEFLIDSVCQTIAALMEGIAIKKQINFDLKISRTENKIFADERLLRQVIINLLSNAFKFTPEGGKVGLELKFFPESDHIEIRICDTGIGIACEKMMDLFKPFIQLDSDLTRKYAGTGLGLAYVYRIIKMHGGGIKIESKSGEGSIFTISLLSNIFKRFPKEKFESLKGLLSKDRERILSILLVEDNDNCINNILDIFSYAGAKATVVSSQKEIFDYLKGEKPDLILLNIQTPNIDETDVMDKLRSNKDTFGTRVIAITILDLPGNKEKYIHMGFNDYICKPLSPRVLINLINRNIKRGN